MASKLRVELLGASRITYELAYATYARCLIAGSTAGEVMIIHRTWRTSAAVEGAVEDGVCRQGRVGVGR